MIKLVCFVVRKPGSTRDAFFDHWRNRHGPLIAGIPELASLVTRYEQNHRLEADAAREEGAGFDGATIMTYESRAAYDAFAAHPLYAERIAPDEAEFMDRSQTVFFMTDVEDVKIGGPSEQASAQVKLLALLRRRSDLSAREFHTYWAGPHAALFSSTREIRDRLLAYQQNHRLASDYAREKKRSWDGLAEQWYASLDDFYAGAAGPAFAEVIAPDEEKFIDRGATKFILSDPAEVVIGS